MYKKRLFYGRYFFMTNTKAAGRIYGNPLCGLCERVCIEVKKVFDGCITRIGNIPYTIALSNFTPGTVQPYTYVTSRSSGASVVSDLVVISLQGRRTRLRFNVTTPVTVYYTDSLGASGSATGNLVIKRDIVLSVPEDSVVPYYIEAATSVTGNIGTFNPDGTSVTVTPCIVQIVRVVANVEILVPSYGYCEYPEVEEFNEESCEGVFGLPVFPPSFA